MPPRLKQTATCRSRALARPSRVPALTLSYTGPRTFTRWPRFRLSRLQRSVGARVLSGLVIRALGASTPGLLSPPCGPRHPVQPTRPPAAAFSGPCGSSWKSLPFLKLTPPTSSTETPEHKSQLYLSVFFKSFLFLSFIYTRINVSFKSLHVTLIFR